LEAFTLFMNDDVRCGSKPARWRCRVFFTKEMIGNEIPEEPARRDRTIVPPNASAVVADITHNIPNKTTETPSFHNG
jgi:hypothetical protein